MPDNPRIEDLRRRVQLDPASIAFAALAEEYRRAGRFEEAVATCEAGLQRHPAYLSARVTLGRALLEMGRFADARSELEHVLRLAPENLAAIRALAQIHGRHRNYGGADEETQVPAESETEPDGAAPHAAPAAAPAPAPAPVSVSALPAEPHASGVTSDASAGNDHAPAGNAHGPAGNHPPFHSQPSRSTEVEDMLPPAAAPAAVARTAHDTADAAAEQALEAFLAGVRRVRRSIPASDPSSSGRR
jgi:tetratricopeptide (TPR) repeat protein